MSTSASHVHVFMPTGVQIEWVTVPHPTKAYPWAAGLVRAEWVACACSAFHLVRDYVYQQSPPPGS